MNLVILNIFETDGSLYSENILFTEKPMAFFCSYDNEIKHTFINWLKENNKEIYEEVTCGLFKIEIYYYDKQSFDIYCII